MEKTKFCGREEMTEHVPVLDQINEGKDTGDWLPKKKKNPEMISRTEKALLCYIYTGCSRNSKYFRWKKGNWPEEVKCYFVLKTEVYIGGIYPGNSDLHLTILY